MFQVHGEVLEYQVDPVVPHDDVPQLHDVGVAQVAEERHLADGGAGDAVLRRLQRHLLHGDNLARPLVSPLEHHPIAAGANPLHFHIVLNSRSIDQGHDTECFLVTGDSFIGCRLHSRLLTISRNVIHNLPPLTSGSGTSVFNFLLYWLKILYH